MNNLRSDEPRFATGSLLWRHQTLCSWCVIVAATAGGACGGPTKHPVPPVPGGTVDMAISFAPFDAADAPPESTDLAAAPSWAGTVYAHTATELYTVDPDTLKVKLVAPFGWPNGADQMTDLAVDKNGVMVGVSFNSLYLVDPMTARCKYIAGLNGAQYNGLSFVSQAQIDPNAEEILIGASLSGDVTQIDPKTGKSSPIGNYGGGLTSSGDLVSVEGATYATVKYGGIGDDYLAQVDPLTGKATVIGKTGFTDLWGVGYWKGQVFGFSSSGEFVLIDVKKATGHLVSSAPNLSWWGAAVTTLAPTIQ